MGRRQVSSIRPRESSAHSRFPLACTSHVPRTYLAYTSHIPRIYLACTSQSPPNYLACTWLVPGFGGLCPAFLHSSFFLLPLPQCGFGWLSLAVSHSAFFYILPGYTPNAFRMLTVTFPGVVRMAGAGNVSAATA